MIARKNHARTDRKKIEPYNKLGSMAFSDLCRKIKWDSDGLVPCVVQDSTDRTVLMVAYMNRDSLRRTIQLKKCHFWSRSRKKLWLKGEESGNMQIVKGIFLDCDRDCVLVRVKQKGGAACHTGMKSCFFSQLNPNGGLSIRGKRVFDPEKVYSTRILH